MSGLNPARHRPARQNITEVLNEEYLITSDRLRHFGNHIRQQPNVSGANHGWHEPKHGGSKWRRGFAGPGSAACQR
jgi:hypothetical protein